MPITGDMAPTNLPAWNAWRHLRQHEELLARSTERLSSGLRINRAEDDPVGLAVADRHELTRRGLQVAVSNIEQATSMLQTAEGAIGSIVEIVQSIREKAVEAASATTQDARNAAQTQIDQWLAEIDREASETVFSGRKLLLDGSLTGFVSTDSPSLSAYLRGTPVSPGSYFVDVNVAPGTGQVLEAGPFTLRASLNDQYAAGVRGRALDVSQNLLSAYGAGHPPLAEDDFTLWTNHEWSSIPWGTTGNVNRRDYRLETASALGPGTGDDVVALSAFSVADPTAHAGFQISEAAGDMPTSVRSYLRAEITAIAGTGVVGDTITLNGLATQSVTMRVSRVDDDGTVASASIALDGTQLVAGQDLPALVTSAGYTAVYNTADSLSRVQMGQVADTFSKGDVLLLSLDPGGLFAAGDVTIRLTREGLGTDPAVLPAADTTGTSLSGAAGDQPRRIGLRSYVASSVAGADGWEVAVTVPYLDALAAAQVGAGRFRLGEQGDTVAAAPRTVDFNLEATTLAERATYLRNLAEFASGTAGLFDAGGRTMQVHALGNQAGLAFGGGETLEQAARGFRDALRLPSQYGGLGLSVDADLSRWSGVDANLGVFVDHPAVTGEESLAGALILRSPVVGPEGRLAFSGDGDLIDAFGFAQLSAAVAPQFTVTLRDSLTGLAVGARTTAQPRALDMPSGVDLVLSPDQGVSVTWDNTAKELVYEANGSTDTYGLHVAPNLMMIQTGAMAGDTVPTPIGEVSTASLGLAGALVVDQSHARETIGRADAAIDKLSLEQTRVGAYVERLQSAKTLDELAAEYSTAAERNIRGVDAAREVIEWMSQQLLSDQASAMLAQANLHPSTVWSLLAPRR
jgi:flagellin